VNHGILRSDSRASARSRRTISILIRTGEELTGAEEGLLIRDCFFEILWNLKTYRPIHRVPIWKYSATTELFVMQSHDGIDGRGAPGGDVTGQQSCGYQDCRDGNERERITWPHSIQKVGEAWQ
jgi:hypothetical protein